MRRNRERKIGHLGKYCLPGRQKPTYLPRDNQGASAIIHIALQRQLLAQHGGCG